MVTVSFTLVRGISWWYSVWTSPLWFAGDRLPRRRIAACQPCPFLSDLAYPKHITYLNIVCRITFTAINAVSELSIIFLCMHIIKLCHHRSIDQWKWLPVCRGHFPAMCTVQLFAQAYRSQTTEIKTACFESPEMHAENSTSIGHCHKLFCVSISKWRFRLKIYKLILLFIDYITSDSLGTTMVSLRNFTITKFCSFIKLVL